MSSPTTSSHIRLKVLISTRSQHKKRHKNLKERKKLYLFEDDITVYVENPKDPKKKDQISLARLQVAISTCTSIVFPYASNKQSETKKFYYFLS